LNNFDATAFGKNDIRGIVGESITNELFELVGRAYAKYIMDKCAVSASDEEELWVSVAQDARFHSPELTDALIEGLRLSGVNVLDIGLCPTPLAYFSEYINLSKEKINNLVGTLIVTASHNPSEYNGIKMTFKKSTLSEQEIEQVKEIARTIEPVDYPNTGIYKQYNIIPEYINTVVNSFSNIGKGIKIVVDSANATGGVVAPQLYRDLGCEVIDIFSEPDGRFPNHHPNPSDEKTLISLKKKIKETNADFGIAFDGDSDRVGIVDNTGYSIPGDQLLLIFALDILTQFKERNEKPVFISEVKCSQLLFDLIDQNGGQSIMWKTGHAFIKTKMKEENAILAGEMSGHIFFRDRYYGYDDAIYAGCRFIEIIAKNKVNNPDFKASDLIKNLPKTYTSKEERVPCKNELKEKVLKSLKKEIDKNPDLFGAKIEKIITIDGLRVVFKDGFALIRQSNTEPTFTLRFEASSQKNLDKYKDSMLNILDQKLETLKTKSLL
jgi:phosphomannomutase/phosphoglucomutase